VADTGERNSHKSWSPEQSALQSGTDPVSEYARAGHNGCIRTLEHSKDAKLEDLPDVKSAGISGWCERRDLAVLAA